MSFGEGHSWKYWKLNIPRIKYIHYIYAVFRKQQVSYNHYMNILGWAWASAIYGHNYDIKWINYIHFQCQIYYTPCTVHIDHIASIEVHGMFHVTDAFKV